MVEIRRRLWRSLGYYWYTAAKYANSQRYSFYTKGCTTATILKIQNQTTGYGNHSNNPKLNQANDIRKTHRNYQPKIWKSKRLTWHGGTPSCRDIKEDGWLQHDNTLTNPSILTETTQQDTGRHVHFTNNTIQDEITNMLQEGSSLESIQ